MSRGLRINVVNRRWWPKPGEPTRRWGRNSKSQALHYAIGRPAHTLRGGLHPRLGQAQQLNAQAIETIHAGYWQFLRDLSKIASALNHPQTALSPRTYTPATDDPLPSPSHTPEQG